MKKVLSLVLVTLMILACVPMSVFGAVATTDVCKIGDVGYATLNAAIDAVKDGETIVLVKDATLTKLRQDAIDYTIDGQNKAYTVDIPSGTYYTGSANITFKGVNVDMGTTSQALLSNDAQQTGDVTFDNCHVKTYNDSGYKLNGRGNFTIKNGSLWEKMTGTNAVFFFQVDHEFNEDECIVTVDNSTVVNYAGSTTSHQTNNIFHWYSGVSSPIKFYFKGNTILKNASTVANATRTCLFYINNAASSVEIHCDSTVEFIVAPTAKAQGNFIYNTNANAAVTIYGVPKLTANDAVAANEGSFPGIYFPYNMDGVYSADGSIKYTKWTDGTNTYNFNSKYTGSAASFYPVADATATEGKVAFIKDKRGINRAYYATLDAAIAAVADGETIVLIKNGTLSAFNQNAINYKIDGQNKTYTIQTGAVDIGIGNGNVTFKDVKIDLGAGSAKTTWRNAKGTNGDITFIGCQINAYNNSHYRLEGLGNFTLKNSSWDKMTGGATAFYANGTSVNPAENECNFIVEDSTITNHEGSPDQIQNNNIFHWNSANGTVKIHLKGNTVIKNASEVATAKGACLFYNEQSGTNMTIYAEPTVQLILAPTSTQLTSAYFVFTKSSTGITKIYGSPQFLTTASVVEQGVLYMPMVNGAYSADGSTAYDKWTDGTNQYDHGALYTGTATSFAPISTSDANDKEAYITDSDGITLGYYVSLSAAISAVKNNQTIVLVKNATLSELNQNAINYTIDGQGKTFTLTTKGSSASGGHFINIGNANVTFKDLKINMGGTNEQSVLQCDTNKTGDFIFDNCEVKAYSNSFYKLNGKGNFTLINSSWDKMTGGATAFYFRGDHPSVTDDECVITIIDSTITNYEGSTSLLQNNNIFHWNSANGSTVKFFIKGNSVLKNASTVADDTGACIFFNQQPGATMIINAEPTVQFIMAPTSTAADNTIFIYSDPLASTKIIGAPNYVVNDTVATKNFRYNNSDADITYGTGGTFVGFVGTNAESGEKIITSSEVSKGTFTKGFSVKPYSFTADDFDMQDGASIRTQKGTGIRFSSNISNDLLETLGNKVSFGTLIASNILLNNHYAPLTLETLNVSSDTPIALKIASSPEKWQDQDNGKVYRAALINVPDTAKAYVTQFAARAYMTVTYSDGSTETFYSVLNKENIRSMYNVATNLSDNSSSAIKQIKDVVNNSGIEAPVPIDPVKSIDLYLIAGQSNAVGYTLYNESQLKNLWPQYKTGVDNIKLMGYAERQMSHWSNVKAGQGSSSTRMGAEVGMASTLSTYYTGDKVAGIIKHAYGGTSIFNNVTGYNVNQGNWVSPSYAKAKGISYSGLTGGLYRGLVAEVRYGIKLLEQQGYTDINIKGVFWMQGESDRGNIPEYEIAITYLINDLRADIGEIVGEDMSSLPIMIGEISRTTAAADTATIATNEAFIEMQRGLANKIDNVYIIASGQYEINTWNGTTSVNGQDAWHWTTEPMFRIGELVGECILTDILKQTA